MYICPVCGKNSASVRDTEHICEYCGFDESSNYEKYPTFAPVPPNLPSIAARRRNADPISRAEKFGFLPHMDENGCFYFGERKDDLPHGWGMRLTPDGKRYMGEWKHGQRDGWGMEMLPDGRCYKGSWKNDMAEGYGVWISPDGSRYAGEWKHSKWHGHGIRTWPNGGKYEGMYEKGLRQGHGVKHDRYRIEYERQVD